MPGLSPNTDNQQVGGDPASGNTAYKPAAIDKKATAAGSTAAMIRIGQLYAAHQNFAKTREWYEKAVAAGSADAMLALSFIYRTFYADGHYAYIDDNQAHAWAEKAAAAGSTQAMYLMGSDYEDGVGVDRNPSLARQWYEKAASLGNESAKDALKKLTRKSSKSQN